MSSRKYLKKSVAGKSVMGRDIFVVSSEPDSAKPSLVLIARQHPPEIPGGTIGFEAFFEEVVSDSDIAKAFRSRFNLYVFPLLNPDGADEGQWRHNANGADLNRDWVDFTQPETRTARDFIVDKVEKEGKEIWFGADFHTSYSGPYLLIYQLENERKVKTRIIPNLIKESTGSDGEIARYSRRDQELPYCYNWFFQAFAAEAVTYEDGDEVDRSIIRTRGRTYAKNLMKVMLDQLNTLAPE
ncbi:M14 family metallopeptidase [Porticoccus sp. W117]|uniref:M14 family metallopeptidase n=1 Tax=Porticoccus sp. W117 TaxID=3054777 RepID=UPI002593F746|nr:M14 family metallopeptidase [Porticoccus sp. W117]MDM3869980.1 M14 family metallopeptidase [Porticoccus sp. W117]